MTYSVYNIKIDNDIRFPAGITAGYVLSINSDGSTDWVASNGGGGGLNVDFTVGATATLGATISSTSITSDQVINYYVATPLRNYSNLVIGQNDFIRGTNSQFKSYTSGTYSIIYTQSDGTVSGAKAKDVIVSEKQNPLYIYTSGSTNNLNKFDTDFNQLYSVTRPSGSGFNSLLIRSNDIFHGHNAGIIRYDLNWNVLNQAGGDHSAGIFGLSGSTDIFAGQGSNIRRYTQGLSQVWSQSHGNTINSIAVDSSNNVYIGGVRASNLSTRKYNSSGNLQWSVDHGATVNSIDVDSSNNVYTGGNRTSNLTTRKYNSSGNLQWSVDHGANVNSIAVDSSGNVYTVGLRASNLSTRKYNSDGNLQWSVDHGAAVNSVVIGPDGNVYTVGNASGGITLRKYDTSGNLLLSGGVTSAQSFLLTSSVNT